jgi:TrmH family RNA methyltransferase
VLEGVRLAEEAVAAKVPLAYALYTAELRTKERGAALLASLGESGAPLYLVSAETLAKTADTRTPQGIIALFQPPVRALAALGPGLVLLLDNLQDPGNLGTVIRTTEAFGGAGLVVCGGVDPYNPKVIRSAMGSLFRLPVIKAPLEEALAGLRAQGRSIFVADAGGAAAPWEVDLRGDAVLVIGNEGAGPAPAAHAAARAGQHPHAGIDRIAQRRCRRQPADL